jgi:hypothetical protein
VRSIRSASKVDEVQQERMGIPVVGLSRVFQGVIDSMAGDPLLVQRALCADGPHEPGDIGVALPYSDGG